MSDLEKRIRHLYMYYLKEGVEDKDVIMDYILDDIGDTEDNVVLLQKVLNDDQKLPTDIEQELLRSAKDLYEYGYFDDDSYVTILDDLENKEFSVRRAFDYLESLHYNPDSDLYNDLDELHEANDLDEENNDNVENNDVNDIHSDWIEFLKSKIAEDCNSDGYYEVYWDYNEELQPSSIQEIVNIAINSDLSVVAAADDYLWDLNSSEFLDESFIDDIRSNVPEKLKEYALDRDIFEDLEEAGYNGVDMNVRELLDKSEVRVNIVFATPEESNYDMSSVVDVFGSWKDPAYDYIIENPDVLDNAMTYLIHQQGHSLKEYYQCLLENPDGFDMKHKSTFIESVVDDCVNNSSDAMSGFTCLTRLSPYELYDLYKAQKEGNGSLEFSSNTYCGTVNIWSGSGGLSVELEKPLVIPTRYIHIIQVEGGKNNNGYTVDEIFGLVGSCWDGEMTFTNSQPTLYEEDKEDLMNYIKTLVEKDEEE